MCDETEMNHELSEEQSQVELALRGLERQTTAIDQSEVLYQAGWAAAVAEFGLDKLTPKETPKPASKLWPALALSFAATTAACLCLLLGPTIVGGSSIPVATSPTNPISIDSKDDFETQRQQLVAKSAVESRKPLAQSTPVQFPSMFGLTLNRIADQRNAQIARFVAEAASPTEVTFYDSQIDWDFEESVPLTPRSIRSGSL